MNRNSEIDLSMLPRANIGRSIFNRNYSHKTSFNTGEVIPFHVDEVIPGDTHNIRTSVVCRLQTLDKPLMDNMYLDTYYFFVPMRLIWDHWKQFCGENDQGPWITGKIDYQIPYLEYPNDPWFFPSDSQNQFDGWKEGTLADYMGIPVNIPAGFFSSAKFTTSFCPSALPFRAYAKCIDEFFRDQNLQQPVVVHTDDVIRTGTNSNNWITSLELGGKPFVAARLHNYFSSCLPAPQRSLDVSIFGGFNTGTGAYDDTIGPFAPVITRSEIFDYGQASPSSPIDPAPVVLKGVVHNKTSVTGMRRLTYDSNDNTVPKFATFTTQTEDVGFTPSNLWATLNIPEATISNLRMAFQLQKYYEASARAGARYREYLKEFFGVDNGDARMQIPEYLGGHRVPLVIHQVANQSESSDASLGDLGAMSNTSDVHDDVHMSFTEHGYILGLAVVRYDNTFSQGLERFWTRRNLLEFYNPIFANISDQPVYTRELALYLMDQNGNYLDADHVFGYNEAWADYRYKPSRVSSEMRPESERSLASWHLADDYSESPFLSDDWIQISKSNVDRVLNVTSENANQIFCDFYVENKCVRPMPVHSIPGLADHH